MSKVLEPQEIINIDGKVVFLAGPIQGSKSWQDTAIDYIHSINKNIYIANPRIASFDDNTFDFEKQVDWESYYLNRASENGVIFFWLAKERMHICERAYAQTSRFELGEWKSKYEQNKINLVLGIEEGFSNARYIKYRFNTNCPEIIIHHELLNACNNVLELCNTK